MKKSYRWDHLTSREIGALAEAGAIVLLPLGATEQEETPMPPPKKRASA